jgi:hypothetical protein
MYCTVPGGVELFPGLGPPACVAPKPPRRNLTGERARRIARVRDKNRRLRPVNAARRRLEFARNREIYHRKERNRHRHTMMAFKGHRNSTSPYMRWVNDPYEPETLPPDWQPPPQPDTPDEPPF